MSEIKIRPAEEKDIDEVRQLFVDSYGTNYRYREFYDDYWLKKAGCRDNYLFLVASLNDRIVGSGTIYFDVDSYTDLQGEFGRLVVHPDARHRGLGNRLMAPRLEFAQRHLHFGFIHGRCAHDYAQRIAATHDFVPLGFLPQKSLFSERESIVVMGQLFRSAQALHRNNLQVIPEIFPLAAKALHNLGLQNDLVVIENADGYPMHDQFVVREISETGIPHLLRIERGRLKRRQVFGRMMLSYGLFALRAREAQYLVALQGDTIGAIGYVFGAVGKTIQIIELIDVDDAMVGFLLHELDRRAREELDVAYVEAAVSAYRPRIQRTLDQLGFCSVAYCPSYVFRGTERLDVIRMAKLYIAFDVAHVRLVPAAREVFDLVVRRFLGKRIGIQIDDFTRSVSILKGLDDVQFSMLSGICKVVDYAAGEVVFRKNDPQRDLYMVLSGEVDIFLAAGKAAVGKVLSGDVLGEISLVEGMPHSATAVAAQDSRLIVLSNTDFETLIQRYPRIGMIVMRNIARSLGVKLKQADVTMSQILPLHGLERRSVMAQGQEPSE